MSRDENIISLSKKLNMRTFGQYAKHIDGSRPFGDNLLSLLSAENDLREQESLKRRIKRAGFPVIKTLGAFEFSNRLPHLNREQVDRLAQCDFIKLRTNVCALGNSGTGKTHLMTAIGMEAIRKGYSVRFYRANDLVVQLAEAESEKRLGAMLKPLRNSALLCLDELGYITMTQEKSHLLFQVLAARYETRSTFITSNMEFSKWSTFLGDPVMTEALIDRLVHRSAVLNMNGEGYRTLNRGI